MRFGQLVELNIYQILSLRKVWKRKRAALNRCLDRQVVYYEILIEFHMFKTDSIRSGKSLRCSRKNNIKMVKIKAKVKGKELVWSTRFSAFGSIK